VQAVEPFTFDKENHSFSKKKPENYAFLVD
jgi:hypothetical protein